jgi:hypothetical protein
MEKAHAKEVRACRDMVAGAPSGNCPLAAYAMAVRHLQGSHARSLRLDEIGSAQAMKVLSGDWRRL